MSSSLIYQGVIRPIREDDAFHFYAHLIRLDEQSRHDRFHGGISDAALLNYAEKAVHEKGFILGFFIDGQLRGAVEMRFMGELAEFAVTVEPHYQQGGIGSALMGRSVEMARKAGIKNIHLNFIPNNQAMQQLAARHGASFNFLKDGTEADFSLAA